MIRDSEQETSKPIRLQQEGSLDFVIVDHDQSEYSCEDVPGYEFIESMDECKEAEEYIYTKQGEFSNINLDSYKDPKGGSIGRWFIFNNLTERPYGCYYFPRNDKNGKIVHPKNMCKNPEDDRCKEPGQISYYTSDGSIKVQAKQPTHRQICKKATQMQQTDTCSWSEVRNKSLTNSNRIEMFQGLSADQCKTRCQDNPVCTSLYSNNQACVLFNDKVSNPSATSISAQGNTYECVERGYKNTKKASGGSVKPRVVPFCQLNKGTLRGENIQRTSQVYKCPEGSSILCPNGFEVDDAKNTTACVWKDRSRPPPSSAPPEPICKPDVAKTVYTAKCLPNEVTEQTCSKGVCIRQGGPESDCLCPDGVEVTEISCRAFENIVEEETATMNCGEYGSGYQLACPEGYTLNPTTQLCDEDSVLLYEYEEYEEEEYEEEGEVYYNGNDTYPEYGHHGHRTPIQLTQQTTMLQVI